MKTIEIEAWALRVLESLKRGAFVEDSLVELKAKWPDPDKAARQIAGHANAARGAPILWLVGVDEKNGAKGANYNELSSWYLRVAAEFDGIAPTLSDVNVPFDDTTIAALCFDTDRAPYVVRNAAFNTPGGGKVSFEVPWREGSATRTARRADLIRILAPLRLQPKLELLEGILSLHQETDAHNASTLTFHAYVKYYIAPRSENTIVFPYHKIRASARTNTNKEIPFDLPSFQDASKHLTLNLLRRIDEPSVTVHARLEPLEITASELIVRGPRRIALHAHATIVDPDVKECLEVRLDVFFLSADDDISCGFSVPFKRRADQKSKDLTWEMQTAAVRTNSK